MSAYESKVRARVLVAHYTGDSFRRLSRNSQRRMGDTTVTPDERRTTEQETERLIDLIRSMLVLDSTERPAALQLLEAHPWLDEV